MAAPGIADRVFCASRISADRYRPREWSLTAERKERIHALLKGIETGDPESIEVVNPNKYIQHNPQTQEGGEGLAALFKRLSLTSPRVNIVRLFSDGDFVFGHTEYDFSTSRVGFEVFRFEGDQTVEHWDNIQRRQGPNPSGHSMTDGATQICDREKTEDNRVLVRLFVADVLIGRDTNDLTRFVDAESYTEHSPERTDELSSLTSALSADSSSDKPVTTYQTCHRLLAEGNFVLAACEGFRGSEHTAFYDLFRIDNGKIVEHWDTIEGIAPRSEWKNENGKF